MGIGVLIIVTSTKLDLPIEDVTRSVLSKGFVAVVPLSSSVAVLVVMIVPGIMRIIKKIENQTKK